MMNVYFLISGFRQRNASAAEVRRSNRMPLFSDTIEHGSTSVDAKPVEFTAHGRDRGFATRTPRNNQSQGLVTTHV